MNVDPEALAPKYQYRALVTGVYDGDSITCTIELGLDVIVRDQKIRLAGIDTPELRGEDRERGLIVRDGVRRMILNEEVILLTDRDRTGKYGRWLATVYHQGRNINQLLLDNELAEVYE